MIKYLIRYRDDFGVYYCPVYECSVAEAVRRFRVAMDGNHSVPYTIEAVFVEVGGWQ